MPAEIRGEKMEKRDDFRHTVNIQGRYRTGRGFARDVVVTDLSRTGCRIFDRFSSLSEDGYISIRIGSIGPIEARIRWREHSTVGLEFADPIHPAVFEHMRFTIDGWSESTPDKKG